MTLPAAFCAPRYSYLQRAASKPVASLISMSAISSPRLPYGWWQSSVPSGRTTAEVVGDPSLAQFTVAKKQVFSAARHKAAFSWNEFAGSAKIEGR